MPLIVGKLNAALLHGVLKSGLHMVFNAAMNAPHPDRKVIMALGGPTEVARRLGLDTKTGGVQRVQNWMTRGIPAQVRLDNLELFGAPTPSTAEGKVADAA